MYGYWNGWYSGFGWILWFGFIFLLFASMGNWGYAYRAHRKVDEVFHEKDAIDILNERYAKGEIKRDDYIRMRTEISESRVGAKKVA